MTAQNEVDRRAREYLRTQWMFDDKTINEVIDDPVFTGSMTYHRIEVAVAVDEFKAALVASLPRWLRRLFEEAR